MSVGGGLKSGSQTSVGHEPCPSTSWDVKGEVKGLRGRRTGAPKPSFIRSRREVAKEVWFGRKGVRIVEGGHGERRTGMEKGFGLTYALVFRNTWQRPCIFGGFCTHEKIVVRVTSTPCSCARDRVGYRQRRKPIDFAQLWSCGNLKARIDAMYAPDGTVHRRGSRERVALAAVAGLVALRRGGQHRSLVPPVSRARSERSRPDTEIPSAVAGVDPDRAEQHHHSGPKPTTSAVRL